MSRQSVRKGVRKVSGRANTSASVDVYKSGSYNGLGCQGLAPLRFATPGPLAFPRLPLDSGLAGRGRSLLLAKARGPGLRPGTPSLLRFMLGHHDAACSSGETGTA